MGQTEDYSLYGRKNSDPHEEEQLLIRRPTNDEALFEHVKELAAKEGFGLFVVRHFDGAAPKFGNNVLNI